MSNKEASAVANEQDQQTGLVPTIRFPEFQDAQAWQKVTLKDVLRPAIREIAKPSSSYTGLGLRSHGKGTFQKEGQDPAKNSMDRLYVVHRDDLIVNITFAWEGAIAIANDRDHGCYVSHRFPTYEFEPGVSSPDFFRHVITDKAFVYRLGVISPGGAGRNRVMNKNDFLRISTYLPSVREQQKIADCLSSIAALISAEADKLDALKNYKTGLMQQLFPAPGETIPRLRFPEFQEAEEWEDTTIGNIGRFYYGKSAPKWSLEENAPTPCVRYGELYGKFGVVISKTFSKTNIDVSNLRFSKGGEILVPRVGEKPEDFGKCCCYLPLANIAIGEMISVFETEQNPLFYTYYFRRMYKEFARVVEGQNVKNLYYSELEPLAIFRPKLPEQKRIADCLISLDTLIAEQTNKIDALKAHKRGLIQQLFPISDEVIT